MGKQTATFARFSTVGGERGSADTERDPRGFAVRFYTEEGNWDLVGNNTPMFFIKDPIKFPDFVHTQKRDPQSNLKSAEMMFDFWSHAPESLHQVTMLFSDRGTPDGYRHMDGFGSHTYSLINADGQRVYVKWHFKTRQGIKNLPAAEAGRLAGADPDYAQRDLFGAIERGDFPQWEVKLQVATQEQLDAWEQRTGWNPFDLTKVWPHADFPLLPVGYFRAEPQSGQLPRGSRAGGVFAGQRRAGHGLLAGQDAARPAVRLPRRPAVPGRHQPPALARECGPLPLP